DENKPPGTKDIVEYIDEINEMRTKIMPLVRFLSVAAVANEGSCCVMTSKETEQVVRLLREMLDRLFIAVDGIKETHGRNPRA
ncbi:MAG: hypothetical protein WA162_01170, partial [Thermodesulfobacteriota bacterium]